MLFLCFQPAGCDLRKNEKKVEPAPTESDSMYPHCAIAWGAELGAPPLDLDSFAGESMRDA